MKNENKMYSNPQYKCGICGTIFDSIEERMNCEAKCIRKQKEEAKKAAEAKVKEERETRRAEVTAAIERASELLNQFISDYGTYSYDGKRRKDTSDFFWPSRLWHYFL